MGYDTFQFRKILASRHDTKQIWTLGIIYDTAVMELVDILAEFMGDKDCTASSFLAVLI